MKKFISLMLLAALSLSRLGAQEACYWVLLADKQGSTFDPYSYFDPKAVERYHQCGADLYDISNYPVSQAYESQVEALVSENLGPSRWLNAVVVMATPEQVTALEELPFVREVKMVGGEWQLAQVAAPVVKPVVSEAQLTDQLLRMGGPLFQEQGINGKGIRVAVFDGGFPHVNTHQAFKHLRDEGRILKTWNFPDRKENVYLSGSHGTMTLSCIAGCLNGKQIGLATGAEFLLARTEVDPEPFKEEVWWMQAMEWADKNGAQIISSSLGYGKERHYTYEMDGRSYVARAANMAARKGMLVCNSAGNEGDDKRWKTIITPADADSVLCVAGIEDRLDVYRHIDFSSYGPSADGKRKPNVCAFGHAYVAKHSNDTALDQAYGTSFSCPLVAGFAACAWQTRPGATAMEMMSLIEQSADLYPYYDYALGYGVPQAKFFTASGEGATPVSTPTFRFVDKGFYIAVIPTEEYAPQRPSQKLEEEDNAQSLTLNAQRSMLNSQFPKPTFFFKANDKQGQIEKYYTLEFDDMDPSRAIAFRKGALYNRTLVVHYNGYTDSLRLSDTENRKLLQEGKIGDFDYSVIDTAGYIQVAFDETMARALEDNRVKEKPLSTQVALLYGAYLPKWHYSDQFQMALRMAKPLHKRYLLGGAINLSFSNIRYSPSDQSYLNPASLSSDVADPDHLRLSRQALGLELFQRVILKPGGSVTSHGLHWDLGITADWFYGSQLRVRYDRLADYRSVSTVYRHPSRLADWDLRYLRFGLTTRLSWDWIGLFASYSTEIHRCDYLPVLSAGIQLNL